MPKIKKTGIKKKILCVSYPKPLDRLTILHKIIADTGNNAILFNTQTSFL